MTLVLRLRRRPLLPIPISTPLPRPHARIPAPFPSPTPRHQSPNNPYFFSSLSPPTKFPEYEMPSVTWGVIHGRKERLVSRVIISDYLKSIGVVPDELEHLELPSSVEVMRERVDFLHLLVLLGLLAAWCFLYLFRPADPPLVLFGRTFSDRETLGGLVLLSVFVIFLTSVGSLLISALMVGVTIVCTHGAFRVPEDLFLDDQEPGGAAAGLLSFLGGAASSATAAAGPAVAARV